MTDPPTDLAHLLALAHLPDIGPAQLAALRAFGERDAWQRLRAGEGASISSLEGRLGTDSAAVLDRWHTAAATLDPAECWEAHRAAGVGIAAKGTAAFPDVLAGDRRPPALLMWLGDLDVLAGVRVGVVGTRRCTRYGLDVARELGRVLGAAGVAVVSGLAAGIDAAAHQGALEAGGAPPVGVVGTGLDVIYPKRNQALWEAVASTGVLLSEHPLGTPPRAWRFPMRNRLIAALSDVLVVVESHERGGALLTARDAYLRDRPVLAVPGPIRSAASAGTNRLVADGGAHPVCQVDDVLVAVGLRRPTGRGSAETRREPDADGRALLEVLGWQPAPLDGLCSRLGASPLAVTATLAQLEQDGWVANDHGWWSRVARGDGR